MCSFFSCIVTKDRVYWNKYIDSHSALIDKYNLNDTVIHPLAKVVRVEVIPPLPNHVFESDIDKWKIEINQDFLPSWFDLQKYEDRIYTALEKCLKEVVIDNKEIKRLSSGRYFIRDSKIELIGGYTIIDYVEGESYIGCIEGNVRIDTIKGNTQLKYITDNVWIDTILGNVKIDIIKDNVVIQDIRENVKINEVKDNVCIQNVYENAIIDKVTDFAVINGIWGNGLIREINEESIARVNLFEKSLEKHIHKIKGNAIVINTGEEVFTSKDKINIK